MKQLRTTIKKGWPEKRSDLPKPPLPLLRHERPPDCTSWYSRENVSWYLAVLQGTHANHTQLTYPHRRVQRPRRPLPALSSARRPLLALHSDGVEGIRFKVSHLSHRPKQTKELLPQHEVTDRPWSKVAADLCELDNRTLLFIVDYYSNFMEVARLSLVTSRSVIKEMKATLVRYGIVTDNFPQFASAEFAGL